jgi:hypothetical protein
MPGRPGQVTLMKMLRTEIAILPSTTGPFRVPKPFALDPSCILRLRSGRLAKLSGR